MTTAHTPGPWNLRPIRGDLDMAWSVGVSQAEIADVYTDAAHGDANARLIAAAPDLLESAGDVLALLDTIAPEYSESTMAANLRAAVAKALGVSA